MAEHDQGGHGAGDSPFSNSHGGRPKSWAAVIIMIVGFLVAGVALCLGPAWLAFWIGTAVVVIGGIMALAADIWNDVVVEETRLTPEQFAALSPVEAPAGAEHRLASADD